MKFIVSTSALLKQLNLINGVITGNTVLPILEDFLFEIKKGKLTLSSTDLETSMTTSVGVEATENGKVAIPAKMLMEILKSLPEQPLTFTIDNENFGIELSSDNGKYKLQGENGENFPKIPKATGDDEVKLTAKVLARAISNTLFAAGTDELRPAMTGVFFQLSPEGSTFVATDAHRLVKYYRSDLTTKSSVSFIIPRKALSLLKNALPADESEVSIGYDKNNAYFSVGTVGLICRLIDAKYPDYEAVIPQENPNHLTINCDDLQSSVKRVSIFSNKTSNLVQVKLAGSSLRISGQDTDFSNEANESLVCEYNGSDMEIGFNAKFLAEMLDAVSTEQVRFEMSTPTRAGLILPEKQEENENLLMLIMPVMISSYE